MVSLITALLRSKPTERIGCLSGGPSDVKRHTFFDAEEFSWEKLAARALEPPLQPPTLEPRPTAETEGALEDLTEGEPVRDADDAAKWDFAFN